jgi:O-antigen/teichoic acid export membrane protein
VPKGLKKTAANLGFSAGGVASSRLLTVIVFVILANRLPPEDFGAMAIVMIFVSLGQLVSELGFRDALVKYAEDSPSVESSVFWLLCLVSLLLAMAVWAVAPAVAEFFNTGEVAELLQVSAIGILLNAAYVVSLARLQRGNRFGAIAAAEIAGVAIGGLVGIAMAYSGWGAWSIAAQYLGTVATKCLVVGRVAAWVPEMTVKWSEIRTLWAFSRYLVVTRMFQFIVQNGDNAIVGKILDSAALGLYSRAFQIVSLPGTVVGQVANRVMYVRYLELKDPDEVATRFLLLSRLSLLSVGPLLAAAGITAGSIVPLLLGEKWVGMVPVMQILAVTGILRALGVFRGSVFLAMGATRAQMWNSFLVGGTVLTSVAVGAQFGVEGVAWGLLIGGGITFVPSTVVAGRLVRVSFARYVNSLSREVVALIIGTMVGHQVYAYVAPSYSAILAVLLGFVVIFGVFALMLVLLRARVIRDLRFLQDALASRAAGRT